MAYLQNQTNQDNDQSDQNSQQGGQQASSQGNPVNISGTSASGSSAGPSGNSATSTAPQYSPTATKSGSFHNIQNYLDANAGYNNGQGLAGQTYQNLKDQQQQQENAIGSANTQFQQQSSQAGQQYDPNAVSSFVNKVVADPNTYVNGGTGWQDVGHYTTMGPNQGGLQTVDGSQTQIQQGGTQQQANNPSDPVSYYQNFLGAQYNGPMGLQNAGDLQAQAQQYAQTTGLTTSEPGRMALLQKLYGAGAGNNGYTTGQQTLDNLFMQANPDQLAHLQTAQQFGNQVQSDLGQTQNAAQAQAQKYQGWANQAKDISSNALTQAANNIDTSQTTAAQQAAGTQQADYKRISDELNSGSISKSDLAMLGLSPDQVSNLYGLNLSNINGNNPLSMGVAPTKETTIQQGDLDRLNALAKLGGTYTPNIGVMAQDYQGGQQNGAYDPGKALSYDKNAALAQLGIQKGKYQHDFNNIFSDYGNVNSPNTYALSPGATVTSTGDPIQDIQQLQNAKAGLGATGQGYADLEIQRLQSLIDNYGGLKGMTVT